MAISLEYHDVGICKFVFDAPCRRNAFTLTDWERLSSLIDECRAASPAAVVLTSAHSGMFCAGMDFDALVQSLTNAEDGYRLYQLITAALDALEALPAITLAAIDGAAVGAGCALAMACDLRFAGPRAVFSTPPARLGLVYPAADVRRLVRGVGYANAMRMLSLGERIQGEAVTNMNIATSVMDDPLATALRAAHKIAAAAPGRLAMMKREALRCSIDKVDDGADAETFVRTLQSEEVANRLQGRRSTARQAGSVR